MKFVMPIAKTIIAISVLAFLCFVAYTLYFHVMVQSGRLTYWEGKYYTKQELEDKFGKQQYDTPAKNTPEEVYAEFRQALLDDDVERALGCVRDLNREEYRVAFNDKDRYDTWLSKLPEKIENLEIDGNEARYHQNFSDETRRTIYFQKNIDGYWQINQI